MFAFPSCTLNNAPASFIPPMLMSKTVHNTCQIVSNYTKHACVSKSMFLDVPSKEIPTKEKQLVPEECKSTKPGLIRLPSAKKMATKTRKRVVKKKQVHFQVDENDQIVSQEIGFTKVPKENHSDLYFSRKEKKSMVRRAIRQVEAFLLDFSHVAPKLECAFLSCCNEDVAQEANNLLLRKWSSSKMRGLEKEVTRMIYDDIITTVEGVLSYQAYLEATMGSRSEHDELLRVYSEKLSCRSREFAAKVGVADAFTAKRLYRRIAGES